MAKPTVFIKEVKTELTKVNWPTKNQAVRLTLIVIGVSVAVGIFIGILDYLLTKVMALIL